MLFQFPVNILRPKIQIRKTHDIGERYEPNVTSPFKLNLGEQSEIIIHESDDCNTLNQLIHFPTKPLVTFIALNDVQNFNNVKGAFS